MRMVPWGMDEVFRVVGRKISQAILRSWQWHRAGCPLWGLGQLPHSCHFWTIPVVIVLPCVLQRLRQRCLWVGKSGANWPRRVDLHGSVHESDRLQDTIDSAMDSARGLLPNRYFSPAPTAAFHGSGAWRDNPAVECRQPAPALWPLPAFRHCHH